MFDRTKAVENANKKLARQQETLQQTLAEIEHITKVRPNATALLNMLRVKRDRQESAIRATNEIIEVYNDQRTTLDPLAGKKR